LCAAIGVGVADNLLEKNYQHLSLLEISQIAIQTMKKRLENHLDHVHFYHENILHDVEFRALFWACGCEGGE
jgi:FlaA1/EpsC-like NDP-sugar epimerase